MNLIIERDEKGYVLDPQNPKFKNVELYRGTTVRQLDLYGKYRFTGNRNKASGWALEYSAGRGDSRIEMSSTAALMLESAQRIARRFDIDDNPATPILVIINNAERYFSALKDLRSAIDFEWYVDLDRIRREDLSIIQVSKSDFKAESVVAVKKVALKKRKKK